MKDTRLDDSASIYTKRAENAPSKEKWSVLTRAEKWQFFKDYYMKKLIVSILALGFIVWFLITALSPKPEFALYAAFITSSMDEDTAKQLSEDLGKYLGIDTNKQEIGIDTSMFITDDSGGQSAMASQQKLSVYVYAGDIDILIADRSVFQTYVDAGFFAPLEEILPKDLTTALEESFVLGMYAKEEDSKGSDTEPRPYGISLKGFPAFEALHTGMADPVLAIVSNSQQKDNAIASIRFFTSLQ